MFGDGRGAALSASCACAALIIASSALAQEVPPSQAVVPGQPGPSAPSQQTAPSAPLASSSRYAESAEIVVTANKREERLNKVGLTITALSGQMLAERNITSLQDIAAAVPGLTYAQSTSNTPVFTLRGVGFNESSLGVYPAVSVYIDQAPLPFPVLTTHSAFDLDRIEVLKGPQGTLFGQNSTGGAINYVAAKPTKDLQIGGDIGFGRFNQVTGNAYISGPISNTLRARLAVTGLNADGWQISSSRPDDRNGKQSYIAGRLITDWDATEHVRFSLNLNGWIDTSEPQAQQLVAVRPGVPGIATPEILKGLADVPFSPENPRAADWSTGIFTPRSNQKFYQATLRSDIDLSDDLTLTSLTSYAHYKRRQATDGDGSYLVGLDFPKQDGLITSLNQEVRLANAAGSAFRWVLGANFEHSKTLEDHNLFFIDQTNHNPSNLDITSSGDLNRQNIRNYAFFANGEYDLSSALTIKAAARYTNSRIRDYNCNYVTNIEIANLFNLLGNFLGTVPFTPIGINDCLTLNENNVPGFPFLSTLKEDNVSWRVGVDYRIDSDKLLYANVSRGYKAGSYPTLAASSFVQFQPVTQEAVTAYEAGIKATLLDRRLQVNAAVFYNDYRDKQIRGKLLDPIFNILDALVNIPKSSILGAETDITFRPVQGLTFNGSLTYLDSKVREYNGFNVQGVVTDFAGEPLPFTPKWSYSVNVDYRYELAGGGAAFVGAGANGQSSADAALGGGTFVYPPDPLTRILPGLTHVFKLKPYTTVDGRLGYEAPDGRWRVMIWGKNIFNKYYWTNVIPALDTSARFAGRPATYGVTLGFNIK